MTVITAFELEDLVAPGVAARQPDRAHRCLGPGTDHADELQRGHQFAQSPCHLRFDQGRRTVAEAPVHGGMYRAQHLGMGVAENHRTPGADVIDIGATSGVVDVGACRARNEQRIAADPTERSDRRVDAARNVLLGFQKSIVGCIHDVDSSGRGLYSAADGAAGQALGRVTPVWP